MLHMVPGLKSGVPGWVVTVDVSLVEMFRRLRRNADWRLTGARELAATQEVLVLGLQNPEQGLARVQFACACSIFLYFIQPAEKS